MRVVCSAFVRNEGNVYSQTRVKGKIRNPSGIGQGIWSRQKTTALHKFGHSSEHLKGQQALPGFVRFFLYHFSVCAVALHSESPLSVRPMFGGHYPRTQCFQGRGVPSPPPPTFSFSPSRYSPLWSPHFPASDCRCLSSARSSKQRIRDKESLPGHDREIPSLWGKIFFSRRTLCVLASISSSLLRRRLRRRRRQMQFNLDKRKKLMREGRGPQIQEARRKGEREKLEDKTKVNLHHEERH